MNLMRVDIYDTQSSHLCVLFQVKIICETRDWEHSQELRNVLTEKYQNVVFSDIPLAISCGLTSGAEE